MRGGRYVSVHEWLEDCRAIVRDDKDNLILFTGPEGEGKSTIAFQVLHALDPAFGVDRVFFGIRGFLDGAPRAPQYGAVLADELLSNKRKAMFRDTIELLDFLQVCRYMNLHMGICFPHVDLFEGAILNYRVRWQVHVPRRGVFYLKERVSRTYRSRSGVEKTIHSWIIRGSWRFKGNSGPLWEQYLAAKDNHIRTRNVEIVGAPPTTKPGAMAPSSFEWYAGLRDAFRTLRQKDADAAPPRATIHKRP